MKWIKKTTGIFSFDFPHQCLSVLIGGPFRFWLFLSVVALSLCSCAGIAKDVGLEEAPDIEQRSGVGGTEANPFPLNPFQKYEMVMAAGECRFFTMEVPSRWYWKVTLTAANQEQARRGSLKAEIAPSNPPWIPLPATSLSKSFDLGREGISAVLAMGNTGPTRMALLRLCQDGAPLHLTLQCQVSATDALIAPTNNQGVTTQGQ